MDAKIVKLVKSAVVQDYYFGGERSQESHFYHIKSKVVAYAEDGTQTSMDVFKLQLMCEPGDRSAGESDKYTCTRFSLQIDGVPEVTVPALKGWSYNFTEETLMSLCLISKDNFSVFPM
jgi:hypothetical protein